MKKNNSLYTLFLCFLFTNVVCNLFKMFFQEDAYFALFAIFACFVGFLVTVVIYLKEPKTILKYPVFLFFPVFSALELILGQYYKYRDIFGFVCVILAIITLVNAIIEKKQSKETDNADESFSVDKN